MRPFLTHLVCAEENALLSELRARGEKMRYEPRLHVFHARRDTPGSFAAQMLKYGRGRGELLRRRPRTARLASLAPPALLIYLVLLPLMVTLNAPGSIAFVPGAMYLALVAASALRIGWTMRRPADFPLAAGLTMTVHLCYGTGVLRGLLHPEPARAESVVRWMLAGGPGGVATQQPILESSTG
jgi:hypothetical protein